MLLQDKQTGTLIEVLDPEALEALINPTQTAVIARIQEGQEEQDPSPFEKEGLVFPSGESLPRCWVDANYRNN